MSARSRPRPAARPTRRAGPVALPPRGPFDVVVTGQRSIEWTWTVPSSVGWPRWEERTACWTNAQRSGSPAALIATPLQVLGPFSGTSAPIDSASLIVATTPFDDAQGLPRWADIATVAAGIATGLGLFFILGQLMLAAAHAKQERTIIWFQRLGDREFGYRYSRAFGFLTTTATAEASRWSEWTGAGNSENPVLATVTPSSSSGAPGGATRNDINYVLDFFEEMGGAFNARLLDRRLVRRLIFSVVDGAWKDALWFVRMRRVAGGQEADMPAAHRRLARTPLLRRFQRLPIYAEWELMVRALR